LTDVELGWLIAAGLFAWIRTRAEQATAEGWDTEQTLRLTALDPAPWDAGAVTYILPQLADLDGIDWSKSVGAWSKDTITRFILAAMKLTSAAMLARDVGGSGISTNRKPLVEMQRIASAEAGGSLTTPGELDDDIPFICSLSCSILRAPTYLTIRSTLRLTRALKRRRRASMPLGHAVISAPR
jgi:hypothetical protein